MKHNIKVRFDFEGEVHKVIPPPQSYKELISTVQNKFQSRIPYAFDLNHVTQKSNSLSLVKYGISNELDFQSVIRRLQSLNVESMVIQILPHMNPLCQNNQDEYTQMDDNYQERRTALFDELLRVLRKVRVDPKSLSGNVSQKKVNKWEQIFDEKVNLALKVLMSQSLQDERDDEVDQRKSQQRSQSRKQDDRDDEVDQRMSKERSQRRNRDERDDKVDQKMSKERQQRKNLQDDSNQPRNQSYESYYIHTNSEGGISDVPPKFDQNYVENRITEQQINKYIRKKFRKTSRSPFIREVTTKKALPWKARISLHSNVLELCGLQRGYVEMTLLNDGQEQWPSDVELVCVRGITEGLQAKITPLNPGQARNVELPLDAPKLSGTYETVWRIASIQNGIRRCFGPKVSIILRISPNKPKLSSKYNKMRTTESQSYYQSSQNNQSIICTQQILNKAKSIRKLVGGDIKNYIRFIREQNLENEDIDDIIDLYLSI